MLKLFAVLWPLFALILGGYACRRLKFPNEQFWPGAERFNYFVLFPALLFRSLATAPLNIPALPRIALCVGLVMGLGGLALLLLRRVFHWRANRFGVFVQGTLRFNTYIGLATIGGLYGAEGLTLMALLLAITVPIVNVLSVYAFTSEQSVHPGTIALNVLKNPLIVACLLGLGANFLGLRLIGGLDNFLSLLATTSLPLGLLCVGAALQPQELVKERTALVSNSLSRLLVVPALAYALVVLWGVPTMEKVILVVFFALPTAPTGYVLARQLGGDAHLMAGVITLQTLVAAISLPFLIWLLM